MRFSFALLVSLIGITTIGCASHRTTETRPEDAIGWIDEQIDVQRIIKRRLLVADPIERKAEACLQQDPRVREARFAIMIPHYNLDGMSNGDPFTFNAVITTRESMAEDALRELVNAACRAAGAGERMDSYSLFRDGNTWAVRWGRLWVGVNENPDLTSLRRENPATTQSSP